MNDVYVRKMMKRDISMDLLRIAAAMAVILLHVSAIYLLETKVVNSLQWTIANFCNASTRWCVPVFVMISGAFLLQKNISIKLLYRKYIKHLIVLLLCWNIFYNIPRIKEYPSSITEFVSFFLTTGGGYHLWFIYMLVGVYISIPLLKKIVDGGLSKYVLCLWLLTSIPLAGLSDTTIYLNRFSLLSRNVFIFPFVIKYIGYFVLGHFLYSEVHLSERMRKRVYLLGILGWGIIIVGTAVMSGRAGVLIEYFYDYHNIMVVFVSVSLFVFFRYRDCPPQSCLHVVNNHAFTKFIQELSNLTLGVYLVHVFLLGKIYIYIASFNWHVTIAIPLIWLLTVLTSFSISFVLNKMPYINVLVK